MYLAYGQQMIYGEEIIFFLLLQFYGIQIYKIKTVWNLISEHT